MKRTTKVLLATLFLLGGLTVLASMATPSPALAQTFELKKGIVGNLPEACQATGNCTMCDFVSLFVVLQKVILSIFAGLALVMLIWGGQSMVFAAGNQEKFTAGRKLITSTLLGVLIILAGYLLVVALYGILTTPVGKTPKQILTQEWWKESLGCDVSNICTLPNKCFDQSCFTGDEDLGQRNCKPDWKCCNVACTSPNTCQTNCPAAKNMGPRSCDTNKSETCCQP
ncbi:MAG: pilin [Patescibacteria group bacterium]